MFSSNPTPSTQRTARPSATPARRIPTVCIVDPHSDNYQGCRSLAKTRGVRIDVVASAAAALRLARSTTVDLWVVNTELPGLSGCDLCRMLKTTSSTAAVYLVAEHYSPEVEQSAWAARATMFGVQGAQAAWIEQWLDCRSNQSPPTVAAPRPTV